MSHEQQYLDLFTRKEKIIGVLGLGYVELPIALELAKKFKVIGFDINEKRVEMMSNHMDPSNELPASAFEGCDIVFTADNDVLKKATFFIVAVPTPVDEHNVPDLKPLTGASRTIGKVIKKGDYVVFESTVYPGCTEEDCVPVIEELSGLKYKEDFKVGYSPERINPGDTLHTLTKITKIVSGCDGESLENIAAVYGSIIEPGVYKAASIKVAEAAKVIENTQRDLNIALMNELSQIFNLMDINTYDVLEAAGTKWNFLKFQPGLVGGHCIGVDPYYLTYKSNELGYKPQIILSGRNINDGMPNYIAKKVVQFLLGKGKNPSQCRALIMGATFKENVTDIRNSKVFNLYNELKEFHMDVEMVDVMADAWEVHEEYGVELKKDTSGKYDVIIVAVSHDAYKQLDENYFSNLANKDAILVDIKNMYTSKISNLQHWTL
ncbi:MAG: nucleotide sugar dehydrogenase [Sphingobacteriales bacterium]|nr:nucleotide sugar dehydrogenase [Sphingobacteriales bacterium]